MNSSVRRNHRQTERRIMDNPMTKKAPALFFWQNMPTHHQAASLDELARLWPAEVTGVWGSRISDARRRLGWAEPATTHLRHRYLASERRQWKEEVRGEREKSKEWRAGEEGRPGPGRSEGDKKGRSWARESGS